jgi:uncharacterized protein
MTQTLHRFAPLDLEVTRSTTEGRTVCGIVAPFDVVALVNDGAGPYKEALKRGAFTKTIQERGDKVKFLAHHDKRSNPLGKATLLREDAAGLYGEFYVSKTAAGDEVLELVRDGALDAFSVGFLPIRHAKSSAGVVERTEVALREVSVVTFPAYADAVVTAVREEVRPSGLSLVEARLRLEALQEAS